MEVIQGDITDYSSVLEASRGAHVIVHMASLVDVWYKIPDSLIYSVNIKGEAPTGLVVIRDGEETPIGERFHPGNHKPEEIASRLEDFQGLVSACDLIITRRSNKWSSCGGGCSWKEKGILNVTVSKLFKISKQVFTMQSSIFLLYLENNF